MKRMTGRFSICALFLAAVFMLPGCCSSALRTLGAAKESMNKQEYAAVAALDSACDESCDGCNQLHLIKGDACYRLAKRNEDPRKHYACAASELTEGIRLTGNWQVNALNQGRPQAYTNLCEALRNWRDLSTGGEADNLNDRLQNAARQFLAAEPQNACGVYYLNNALYAQQRACLLHPDTCPGLCSQLQGISKSLEDAIALSSGAACDPNLRELRKEVSQAEGIVPCQ